MSELRATRVRIHLGHHFYGAGNLGDDFMLAGFLAAMGRHAPDATFTCSIPFDLTRARLRFPKIEWLPYEPAARTAAIAACDAWAGLGGSPFQHAQSRWFVEHLSADAAECARAGKPMFFLGVGIQSADELRDDEVARIVAQAQNIWTRDAPSAERLRGRLAAEKVIAAADLAHILFSPTSVPPPARSRVTIVANFDYGEWPGRDACLAAVERVSPVERMWMAQEQRKLPGAERVLHAALPPTVRARWPLHSPDLPAAPLEAVLARWPSAQWLVTSRYHAAIAGAWAGSKIVIIAINEKLRGIAEELAVPCVAPDADEDTVARALEDTRPVAPATLAAARDRAEQAARAFVAAVAHR